MQRIGQFSLLSVAFLVAACSRASLTSPEPPTPEPPPPFTPQPTPSATQTPTQTSIPTPTSTPDPYFDLTVLGLSSRSFGGGEAQELRRVRHAGGFDRVFFNYPSDSLSIHAFADIPVGEGPFPVVIVLHGYIDPEIYTTITYTTRYADAMARAGFIALHPNLRNYPPSDPGPNLFRVGYAVDVLNLIALIREWAGFPGLFAQADASDIALFGHSMGGGIALRVITVDPEIEAVVLYGSMSGNERWNFEKILVWSEGQRGSEELGAPQDALDRISAINHLERIEAAVGIHHGAADELVPPAWSEDLCARLHALEKMVECYSYPGALHTFSGESDRILIERAIALFSSEFQD